MTLPLRPYQADAIQRARAAYRRGRQRILLVAPTGAGKTRMAVEIARGALAKGGKVLWLAHRSELLRQAYGALKREGVPEADLGIIAPWASYSRDARVQIASIHTLVAMRRRNAQLPKARVIVFDEAHHFAADEWRSVAAEVSEGGAACLGLTATPERGDGRAMGDLFDELIPVASIRQLQAMGVLVPVVTFSPAHRTLDLSEDPVAAHQRYAPGERAFCFCVTIAHAEQTELAFSEAGVPAATIHAQTPEQLRFALLEAFRTQSDAPLRAIGSDAEVPLVLCNVYTLTEGVDVPEASCCILARGCGHPGMYLQCVGRVLRGAPNKTRAVLIDLRGSVHEHGLPEADRDYSLEGSAITERRSGKGTTVKNCEACGAVFERWRVTQDGKRQCPECGEIGREVRPVGVSPQPMGAVGRAAGLPDRVATYRALSARAVENGYKPGWIAHRYRALYDAWPSREVISTAQSVVGVQPWGMLPAKPPPSPATE
jgi:superfamily II DNA or RNA helicase